MVDLTPLKGRLSWIQVLPIVPVFAGEIKGEALGEYLPRLYNALLWTTE